jgi:hypothetical protein
MRRSRKGWKSPRKLFWKTREILWRTQRFFESKRGNSSINPDRGRTISWMLHFGGVSWRFLVVVVSNHHYLLITSKEGHEKSSRMRVHFDYRGSVFWVSCQAIDSLWKSERNRLKKLEQ